MGNKVLGAKSVTVSMGILHLLHCISDYSIGTWVSLKVNALELVS